MAHAPWSQPAVEDRAHLFVDFSNLWYAVRAEAARRGDPDRAIRLHAGHLCRILAAGRAVGDAVLVANRAVPKAVLDHFRSSFHVELVESGSISGSEQGGDELLQNAMYRCILRSSSPGTVVLATGDGSGWRSGRGFCETLCAARRQGYGIEVVSFEAALNHSLRRLAQEVGAVVVLDHFYDSIAFLEGLRPARPPSLVHRPTASARAWSAIEQRTLMSLLEAPA
jgi:hypothetical protein